MRRTAKAAIVVLVLVGTGVWFWPKFYQWLMVDSCLDRGGAWDEMHQECQGIGPYDRATLQRTAEAFVPSDAEDLIVAPGLPWLQISFRVHRPWLEFAFDEKHLEHARTEGWMLCKSPSADWVGYEDYAVKPPQYTRQKMYVLYRDGISLTIIGMVFTPLEAVPLAPREPNPLQQGFVSGLNASEQQALQTASDLKLSCIRPG